MSVYASESATPPNVPWTIGSGIGVRLARGGRPWSRVGWRAGPGSLSENRLLPAVRRPWIDEDLWAGKAPGSAYWSSWSSAIPTARAAASLSMAVLSQAVGDDQVGESGAGVGLLGDQRGDWLGQSLRHGGHVFDGISVVRGLSEVPVAVARCGDRGRLLDELTAELGPVSRTALDLFASSVFQTAHAT